VASGWVCTASPARNSTSRRYVPAGTLTV
jgi:hypothetical protein